MVRETIAGYLTVVLCMGFVGAGFAVATGEWLYIPGSMLFAAVVLPVVSALVAGVGYVISRSLGVRW